MIPAIALVGAVDGSVLRAAGWQVRGALHLTPYDDLRDVTSYAGIDDVLADDALNAVAVDGADPLVARHLPALLAKGLHALFIGSASTDRDLLADARRAADDGEAEVAVGLVERWEPWALTAAAAVTMVGTPVMQATVRGWPRGLGPAAELVDLARSWCGDVVSASAAPAPLPAASLGPELPVAWALLHASGATTLVSHEGAPPLVRLSFATARLETGPLGARWLGGDELPLLGHDPFAGEVDPRPPAPPGAAKGLVATAAALRRAMPTGLIATDAWPWPADLGDAQAINRVLAALRESARAEVPVRVG